MDLGLKGKVAIVTGGGQGIGRAYCLGFAREGARVVVADINADTAKQTADEIKSKGGTAIGVKVDVSKWSDVTAMADRALKEFGQIDILVNNAGVRKGMSPIEDFPEDMWDFDMNVNLKGAFYCTKAVARHMKERRYGKIINQSSIAAIRGHRAGGCAYAAAKAGLQGFSRSMALELGKFNINVNTIAPSIANTAFIANLPDASKEATKKLTAMGRLGEPEDFVGIVVFLCSDLASYITAQTIQVDGGERPT
ncbi:MAG: 3-oxoacyl-ACP reductase family protein [Dehalococcoidales bacterium]|nr:3-oxoacyl-ACP reductase family protein [Dehalococcoidales bacterium]